MSHSFAATCLFVLTFLSLAASAQEKQFGSWRVGLITGNEGVYAATMNTSGAVLGQFCYFNGGQCFWLLGNDLDCRNGSEYPVLANGGNGALGLKTVCTTKMEGKSRYAFEEFNEIDSIVKSSSLVGIAFPLQSGLFQVNRFSGDGAGSAISLMRRAAQAGTLRDQQY